MEEMICVKVTEEEMRLLSALRHPVKGPVIKNILESEDC